MNEIPLPILSILLIILLLISAFFSASETGVMTINRYRLKHLAKTSHAARRVQKLLERPDRLLGAILLGNNFANITAAAIASVMAIRVWGDYGVLIASFLLTVVILIFAEVSPKTLAAIYPEKIAFPASFILSAILRLSYPLVWVINALSNSLLLLIGIKIEKQKHLSISREELRTVVHEAAGRIPSQHRSMLLGILDLEQVSIEDIMIPRNEIIGIDINNEWEAIKSQLASTQHTFLPVYEDDLNDMIGILHIKDAIHIFAQHAGTKEQLRNILMDVYFVPEGTSLATQLLNFKNNKKRFALVVDEYGDLQGLITLEDIFEEIVGEYTTDMVSETQAFIHPQQDGSLLIDGSTALRDLNPMLGLDLPMSGAKTLSGLIIEYLEMIPEIGTCCKVNQIPMEIIQVQDNKIKTVKILSNFTFPTDNSL